MAEIKKTAEVTPYFSALMRGGTTGRDVYCALMRPLHEAILKRATGAQAESMYTATCARYLHRMAIAAAEGEWLATAVVGLTYYGKNGLDATSTQFLNELFRGMDTTSASDPAVAVRRRDKFVELTGGIQGKGRKQCDTSAHWAAITSKGAKPVQNLNVLVKSLGDILSFKGHGLRTDAVHCIWAYFTEFQTRAAAESAAVTYENLCLTRDACFPREKYSHSSALDFLIAWLGSSPMNDGVSAITIASPYGVAPIAAPVVAAAAPAAVAATTIRKKPAKAEAAAAAAATEAVVAAANKRGKRVRDDPHTAYSAPLAVQGSPVAGSAVVPAKKSKKAVVGSTSCYPPAPPSAADTSVAAVAAVPGNALTSNAPIAAAAKKRKPKAAAAAVVGSTSCYPPAPPSAVAEVASMEVEQELEIPVSEPRVKRVRKLADKSPITAVREQTDVDAAPASSKAAEVLLGHLTPLSSLGMMEPGELESWSQSSQPNHIDRNGRGGYRGI